MTDNELLALIATSLNAAVAAAGWTYVPPGSPLGTTPLPYPVIQKQQPTQEGIPYSPAVFFEKLFDVPFGFSKTKNTFTSGVMTQTQWQPYETTVQISALVIQHPDNLSIPTASDVVNYLRGYITSRFNLVGWNAQGVNILRPRRVDNPYIEDDRHRNEATPSFDLTLTHKRNFSAQVNYATSAQGTQIIVGSDGTDVIIPV